MIILNVTYRLKTPGTAAEFYEEILTEGIDEATRAEEGNLKYDYYYPAENDSEFFLLENWADEESLEKHRTMPHMEALKRIKDEYVEETVIRKYVGEA